MPRMTGGEALAKSLYLEGVRVIFGLPGVQLYHALDGLAKEPGIRFITTRHEQATMYSRANLTKSLSPLTRISQPYSSAVARWKTSVDSMLVEALKSSAKLIKLEVGSGKVTCREICCRRFCKSL